MSENLKVEIEVTPEIERWVHYGESHFCAERNKNSFSEIIRRLSDVIKKARNKIKVGDLVRYGVVERKIEYFHALIVKKNSIMSPYGTNYPINNCTKASPEECKVILPLLEG